jgi:hypothetical protein
MSTHSVIYIAILQIAISRVSLEFVFDQVTGPKATSVRSFRAYSGICYHPLTNILVKYFYGIELSDMNYFCL